MTSQVTMNSFMCQGPEKKILEPERERFKESKNSENIYFLIYIIYIYIFPLFLFFIIG